MENNLNEFFFKCQITGDWHINRKSIIFKFRFFFERIRIFEIAHTKFDTLNCNNN